MKNMAALAVCFTALISLVGCHSDKKEVPPAVVKSVPSEKPAENAQKASPEADKTPASPSLDVALAEKFEADADFDRPLAQLVSAGKYGCMTAEETEANYPPEKEPKASGKKAVAFAFFKAPVGNKPLGREAIVSKMAGLGYRPATLRELLVFGEKFPEEQKKCPIFAIGNPRYYEVYKKTYYLALDYSQGPKDSPIRSLAFRPACFGKDGQEIFYRSLWVPAFLAVKE